jgi:hypothetical protein
MKLTGHHISLALFPDLSSFLLSLLPQASWQNLLRKPGMTAFLAFLVFPWLAEPAHAITYTNTSVPFNWIDASTHAKIGYNTTPYKFNGGTALGCGTAPPTLDDNISDNIPIGFTFMYSGINFTNVRIMSNGRLQFNNTTCGYGSPVTQLPYPDAGLNYTMRIYGNDLDPTLQSEVAGYNTVCTDRSTCYVSYATLGSAPYRSFVVTWNNVPEWTGTNTASGSYNLQIILQENGEFIYQYGADTPGPQNTTAQIGWQADINDYDVPAVGFPTNNTAIKFYIPRPVVEYRMEQTSWTTAAGQVLDTSGNSRHGTRLGNAQTISSGKVCRGANIPQNGNVNTIDAINTGISIPNTVGNAGTITFWYQGNSAWSGGSTQDAQLLDATVVNGQWFFLVRRGGNTNSGGGRLRFVITDSLGNIRTAETAAITVTAGTWKHIAISWNFNALGGSNQDRMSIYVDGILQTTLNFTTNGTLSSQIGTLYVGDNRSGFTGQNGTGRSTDGALDELRIYNYEGGLALIQRDMNQAGICLDHYAISYTGTPQTCQPTPVTITAHSSGHTQVIMPNNTTQITLSTSTGKGDWSLLNGYGVFSNGTTDDGIATYLFNGEYQAVFGLSHTVVGTVNINVTDGQIVESALEDPSLVFSACGKPFGFNCVEAGANALTGHLFTKLAGTAFSFDVVALKDTNNDGIADAVETAYASDTDKTVTVELVDGSGNTVCSSRTALSPAVSQTLAFTKANQPTEQGRKSTTPMTVAKAYPDLRCRVRDANQSPNIIGCSTDDFAVRPGAVTLSTSASATPPSALAAPKIKAGATFTVIAATSTTATDVYTGALTLDTGKLTAQTTTQDTTQQNGGTVGALSPASLTANQSPAPSGNANYTEVGHLYLAPGAYRDDAYTTVDQPNDCVSSTTGDANLADTLSGGKYGCSIGNKTAVAFGRFVPDHFDTEVSPICGTFSYSGQPFPAKITAKNSSGTTTQNYANNFAKNTTLSDANGAAGSFSPTPLPYSAYIAGVADKSISPYSITFTFANKLTTPATIKLRAVDTDGVSSATGAEGTTSIRSGRLVLQNAYGPETAPLSMPLRTEYYDTINLISKFFTNTLDNNCTSVYLDPTLNLHPDLQLNTGAGWVAGNTTMSIGSGTTKATIAHTPFVSGQAGLSFSGPGAGNIGFVDVQIINMPSWLQFDWDNNGSLDVNLNARANFGIYRGNDRIINWREIIR